MREIHRNSPEKQMRENMKDTRNDVMRLFFYIYMKEMYYEL